MRHAPRESPERSSLHPFTLLELAGGAVVAPKTDSTESKTDITGHKSSASTPGPSIRLTSLSVRRARSGAVLRWPGSNAYRARETHDPGVRGDDTDRGLSQAGTLQACGTHRGYGPLIRVRS